jgi:lipoprotein-releasing system permease protein
MFKPLSIYLGLRYIRGKQKKGFGAFISASSTLGIALGVMVLIIGLSAMNGFEHALAEKLLSVVPHSELISVKQQLSDWRKTVQQVEQHPNVIAAAPVIKIQGMMQKKSQLKFVELRGVDEVLERNVSAIPDYMSEGKWSNLSIENGVIIGSGVAKKLGVSLGDNLQMLFSSGQNRKVTNQTLGDLVKRNMTVVGIFSFGGELDASQAYISLKQASNILNYESLQAQGVRLKIAELFDATRIANEAALPLNEIVYLYDWTMSHGHLYNDIQLVRMVMFSVIFLVIGVASFNIVSTLIMAVNEKQSDIAILITMGAKPITIMFTFIFQGIINGINGCLIGGFFGVLIAKNLTDIVIVAEQIFDMKMLSGDVYFINYLPSYVEQGDVTTTIIGATLMSLVATIYPALRATRIEPAQILGQS